MTASAGRTPPGGAACPASPSGSPWSTAAWISPARSAGRPGSPSSSRCEFTDAVGRVAAGGTALDREVVSQLLAASRHAGDLEPLTPREHDVLALMAEGRSNAGIAAALVLTLGTVEKHIAGIFAKLGLPACQTDNRRVLAVLRYLGS